MSISKQLAAHASGTHFDDLPAQAVAAVKRSLLDALGVTLAAGTLGQASRAFVETARSSGQGPSRVIGFGFGAAPSLAALANGAMSHALDYEDTHDAALVHPHGIALPAALAVAQAVGGITGAQFIAALAVGADISCRLGLAMADDDTRRGWTMRPLLGTYGAAAAVGKLLGLDEARMVQAFALAFNQATCSSGFLSSPNSHMREIRDAFGAQAAVIAAQLAARGVNAYDQPIEGAHGLYAMYAGGRYDAAQLTSGLGRVFEGANVSFKAWPSCRGTHSFIEAALSLREEAPVAPASIARIDAVVSPTFRILCEPLAQKRSPQTANDAKFSVPFSTAIALVHGRLSLADYLPPALGDPEVLAMAQRVHCEVCNDWNFDDSLRGILKLTLHDGRVWVREISRPLGDVRHPMSEAALLSKFMDCVRYAATPIAPERARRIAAGIATLERAPDLSALDV
ncbi:MmgE/PrpD family protein [Variovorax sp. PBL-E5]|uniref:MmgE/PrpD family protein n=1 Tax=Variovorax sp. PBL-E5 TaxID=434014 RepID=UPI00131723D2|nr:MmgE/PrpD family protein [Variovorax sp. PBL-E5]VTU45165.1 2-methylcitrate dehydratase [Variovorax sp. PBL-E5]